jgi:hypothetical protein
LDFFVQTTGLIGQLFAFRDRQDVVLLHSLSAPLPGENWCWVNVMSGLQLEEAARPDGRLERSCFLSGRLMTGEKAT